MSTPYEILACPGLTAYTAVPNTAKPDVGAVSGSPFTSYTKLGANGADNYDEDGVVVKHDQDIKTFRGLGKTGDLKAWREKEGLAVEFTIYDMTLEAYQKAMNNQAITTVAASSGISGSKAMPLLQGYDVQLFALLLRGNASPYGDGWNCQYWLPVVFQNESPQPVFKKGVPAGLKMSFMALQDSTNGFGKFEAQTATAL